MASASQHLKQDRAHPILIATSDATHFVHSIAAFAMVALVTLGVGGTLYRLLRPSGWLASLFGRSLAGGMAASFAILIVAFSAWLLRGWVAPRYRHQYPEALAYGFAALGLYYGFEMYSKGVF
ncbi:MAG: hypothetical protein ACRET8_11655 [Burkholderiales bacterium]